MNNQQFRYNIVPKDGLYVVMRYTPDIFETRQDGNVLGRIARTRSSAG